VFLAGAGDEMRFERVAPHEFEALRKRVQRGEIIARRERIP
jgi:hypothetical protein